MTPPAVPGAAAAAIGPLFAGFCDDAAMFPPGEAPAADAIFAHRVHRAAWYRDLVGPFLTTARQLPGVVAAARSSEPAAPTAAVLVVPDGPAAVGRALRDAADEPTIELVGVELACAAVGSAAEAARAAVEVLEGELPASVGGVVEVRRDGRLPDVLDVLAASAFRAKFRTGGTVPRAFPTEDELAAFIVGCVARNLPFKCTAGLHEAARHTDKSTGFEHHGFLNVLAATHVACQGGDEDEVANALRVRSGPALAGLLLEVTAEDGERARRAFTAYGTCSITEPLADLASLGLVVPRS